MSERWQACPVCKGRGDVSADFYGMWVGGGTSVFPPRETCRTCGGAAVLDTLSGLPPIARTPTDSPNSEAPDDR